MYMRCPVCSNEGLVRYCCNHDMNDCKQEDCLHFLSEAELFEAQQPIVCLKSAVATDVRVDIKCFHPWFEFLDKQVMMAFKVSKTSIRLVHCKKNIIPSVRPESSIL